MRALVTGAGGLIGSHLVEALVARGDIVQAWVRSDRRPLTVGAEAVVADITDYPTVSQRLQDFAPDVAFHLAAQSSPGTSWEEPARTYAINVIGTTNLLEAARLLSRPPRLLLAGSSSEYADIGTGKALAEDALIEPNSPYGASKAAATQLAQLYARRYGTDILVFRPFFLAGPGKIGDVCSDFARRVVAIERGEQTEMRVGALDIERDIMDVRDGVSALLRLAAHGQEGEIYNIASGRGTTLRSLLDVYRSLARVPMKIVEDPALRRPLDQRVRIGDATKLMALGWRPTHKLRETLECILNYWRDR